MIPTYYIQVTVSKELKRLVNIDLKSLINWLNGNKISLNVKKNEMVISYQSKRKKINNILKLKVKL